MRVILFVLCIFLSIEFIDNTQCGFREGLVGRCGCCPIVGGNCVHFDTIDGWSTEWHVCVPDHLKDTFTLDKCLPNITINKAYTPICRTNNGTFRFFHQCATKANCLAPIGKRDHIPECHTPMAVKGTCKESLKRYTYDSKLGECVSFIYSGCGGSTNQFVQKNRCEKLCKKST